MDRRPGFRFSLFLFVIVEEKSRVGIIIPKILCAHVKGLHGLTATLFPSLFHSAALTETAAIDQEHDSLVAEGKNKLTSEMLHSACWEAAWPLPFTFLNQS